MTKIGFISLGCSKNLVDTEVMLRTLHDAGFEITPDESEAEILVVNTCGFIESAKSESIDTILELANLKKEDYAIIGKNVRAILDSYAERWRKSLPVIEI